MITLITGVPGGGKTLYAIDQILKPDADSGRQLFVDGIPDLLVPHEPSPDPLEWPQWAPEGAHIVVDEAQRIWRPEAASKAPHASIAAFETHRHRGLDFTIITQHPGLIHANIRRLVGRHIHVRRTALGVVIYEWSECKTSPDTAWKTALTKKRWKHPARSFGLYKSASVHQKVKFRLPKAIWLIIIPLLVLPFAGYFLYSVLSKPLSDTSLKPDSPPQSSFDLNSAPSHQQPGTPTASTQPQPADVDLREQFIPRLHGQPETAPAYDNIRQIVTMPVVAACIANDQRCMCYTQQMTLVEMSDSQCRDRVKRGAFDPYRDAAPPRTERGEGNTVTSSSS